MFVFIFFVFDYITKIAFYYEIPKNIMLNNIIKC
nr:MAG TPA: hypothetical protein [Microviridae sp.]